MYVPPVLTELATALTNECAVVLEDTPMNNFIVPLCLINPLVDAETNECVYWSLTPEIPTLTSNVLLVLLATVNHSSYDGSVVRG